MADECQHLGKFFRIRSQLSGDLVLEFKSEDVMEAGVAVVTSAEDYHPDGSVKDRQLWYEDPFNGSIKNKANNFCIDIEENVVVLNPYEPWDVDQKWHIEGNKIQNSSKSTLVLDIAKVDELPGVLCPSQYDGSSSQHWTFEYQPARYFYIRSQLNGKVVDISGNNRKPGAKVIMYQQHHDENERLNQLWYEDERSVIRAKLNGFALDTTDGTFRMKPFDIGNKKQYWTLFGERIQNQYKDDWVMDIKAGSKSNDASLIPYKYHAADNQHWQVLYV